MPATLSVSGKKLKCENIVKFMLTNGICGDVTENVTVVDDAVERGCRVVVASANAKGQVKKIWNHVSEESNLTCAHVTEGEITSGCVLDFIRASKCPGKQ